jgi:hypothetical protein
MAFSTILWPEFSSMKITRRTRGVRSLLGTRKESGFCWCVFRVGFESSAPGAQQGGNGTTMKNTSGAKPKQDRSSGLKPEYSFDYAKGQPNRFAGRARGASLAVQLDPDVARVFQDAESVNTVLRALLATMPVQRVRGTR